MLRSLQIIKILYTKSEHPPVHEVIPKIFGKHETSLFSFSIGYITALLILHLLQSFTLAVAVVACSISTVLLTVQIWSPRQHDNVCKAFFFKASIVNNIRLLQFAT